MMRNRRAAILAVVVLAAGALTLAYCGQAKAHEFWINRSGYKGPDGAHCCGKNDCHMVPETDVKITPGGYLLFDGEIVPFSEALQSEDGDYWRCQRYDGTRRCFFSPMPAS